MGDQYACFWSQNTLNTILKYLCSNFRIHSRQRVIKYIKICFRINGPCKTYASTLTSRKSNALIRVYKNSEIMVITWLEIIPFALTLTLVSNKCLITIRKTVEIGYQTGCLCHFVIQLFIVFCPDQNVFPDGSFENPCFLRRYRYIRRQLLAPSIIFSFVQKYIQKSRFAWSDRSFIGYDLYLWVLHYDKRFHKHAYNT